MPDSLQVQLLPPYAAASAIATNLALNTFNAVSDPNLRQMICLKSESAPTGAITPKYVRLQGRLGGGVVAASKIRVQYHLGGDPAISSADAGWKTLIDSAGSHTLNTLFYTAAAAIPDEAKIGSLLIRAGLFGGDGIVDPTITCAILNFYE